MVYNQILFFNGTRILQVTSHVNRHICLTLVCFDNGREYCDFSPVHLLYSLSTLPFFFAAQAAKNKLLHTITYNSRLSYSNYMTGLIFTKLPMCTNIRSVVMEIYKMSAFTLFAVKIIILYYNRPNMPTIYNSLPLGDLYSLRQPHHLSPSVISTSAILDTGRSTVKSVLT